MKRNTAVFASTWSLKERVEVAYKTDSTPEEPGSARIREHFKLRNYYATSDLGTALWRRNQPFTAWAGREMVAHGIVA